MFPTKTVKEEISNENIETNELNNKEIKIEVKMEEVDPIAVTSFDNDPLHLDNVKMETNEIDYEAFYVKVKDEFDSEIVEQELENNDEIINKPVMIGDPEVEPSSSSKKLILLPKAVFLDMKAKTKSEKTVYNTNCCVKHCHSRKNVDRTIHFHYFPKRDAGFVSVTNKHGVVERFDRRKTWEEVLLMDKPATSSMRVCSLHFKPEDYITRGSVSPRLKRYAVPSLNLPTILSSPGRKQKATHTAVKSDLEKEFPN